MSINITTTIDLDNQEPCTASVKSYDGLEFLVLYLDARHHASVFLSRRHLEQLRDVLIDACRKYPVKELDAQSLEEEVEYAAH